MDGLMDKNADDIIKIHLLLQEFHSPRVTLTQPIVCHYFKHEFKHTSFQLSGIHNSLWAIREHLSFQ